MHPLYFEWDKFRPTLERQFPDILNKILKVDHQWHLSEQNVSRSAIARDGKPAR